MCLFLIEGEPPAEPEPVPEPEVAEAAATAAAGVAPEAAPVAVPVLVGEECRDQERHEYEEVDCITGSKQQKFGSHPRIQTSRLLIQ